MRTSWKGIELIKAHERFPELLEGHELIESYIPYVDENVQL